MKSKNIWKYGFNYASIIGGIYFLYNIIAFYTKLNTTLFGTFLASLILVGGMAWSFVNYKRNVVKSEVKFGKLVSLGAIMSLVISFFYLLFYMLLIFKLNPSMFDDFLVLYQDTLDKAGYNIDILNNPNLIKAVQLMMFPVIYVIDFIGNLFYALLMSFLLSRQNMFPMQNNTNSSSNDYTPYSEKKTEEKDEQDKDNQEKKD